jgi:hypothetical protein
MMPGDPKLRVSDAERDRTVELLREHHAVGRITAEEYEERMNKVFAAKTRGELDELLADLPAIDLYQLPSQGIRPARRARGDRHSGDRHGRGGDLRGGGGASIVRSGGGVDRRAAWFLEPELTPTWRGWVTANVALIVVWLIIGIQTGGLAWIPWFLLITGPWALSLIRRPRP